MSFGLKVEDRLDRHVNFSAWKERIKCVFEESEVWDIVEKQPTIPVDATQLAEFKKLNAKGKRLILDGIRDHIIPHVRGKDYAHDMWAALISLCQSSNENRKMVLREKLKTIKMMNSEGVVAYLTRIQMLEMSWFPLVIQQHLPSWLGWLYRVFPRLGKLLLMGSLLESVSQIGRGYGMIVCRMRFRTFIMGQLEMMTKKMQHQQLRE